MAWQGGRMTLAPGVALLGMITQLIATFGSWTAAAIRLPVSIDGGSLILVAGHEKCGTSHLHQLLSSHPDVFAARKELCPDGSQVTLEQFGKVLRFADSRARGQGGRPAGPLRAQEELAACNEDETLRPACKLFYYNATSGGSAGHARVLQACIDTPKVLKIQSLVPVPQARVLYAQRDPADLLWASYNFWTGEMDSKDLRGGYGEWTSRDNYRTPAHFHELVASAGKLSGSWTYSQPRQGIRVDEMYELRKQFGTRSVLFLRMEDLGRRDTLQSICDFVGLSISGISMDIFGAKTNSGSHLTDRGPGTVTEDDATPDGVYEVSGFKPMLCETRKIIYSRCRDMCTELAVEFGLVYHACLGHEPTCSGSAHESQVGCCTAAPGDEGVKEVRRAMREGVKAHPSLYPGLARNSTFE